MPALMASSPTVNYWPFIGALLWLVPPLVMAVRMTREQMKYVRLYHERADPSVPTPEQMFQSYNLQPWRVPFEGVPNSLRLLHIFRTRQTDPELERARRRILRLWWFAMAWGTVGMAFPIIFSSFPS